MRLFIVCALFCFGFQVLNAAQPTNLSAFFRSGQTFITWCEDVGQTGETYRVYRHTSAITSGNLALATLIAEVKENSSYFREMHNCDSSLTQPADTSYIDRFIIQPVTSGKGTQLSDTTGIFVYTIKAIGQAQSYYAVTTVSSGDVEETAINPENSAGAVTEQEQYSDAVKYYVDANRDYYIIWLDHRIYNSYTGNAFPFAITRSAFSPGGNMPRIHLDGISTHFPAADYTNYGNMDYGSNGTPTWYFGHHMSLAYDGGCQATSGQVMQDTIANYVQYKHMQAVLWARRHYNITQPKFHIDGNSMGASGAWGFLIAFPSFVTSIWSNEGLTQYRCPGISGSGDTMWASSIYGNYGHYNMANPVKFLAFNDPQYPGLDWVTQFTGMNVYDVRDVAKFMEMNKGKSFGVFSGGHCFSDGSIPFDYNGAPFETYIKDSRQCIGYAVRPGGHNWGNVVYGSAMSGNMRWDESRPGFSNVPAIVGCKFNDPDPQYADPDSRTYMCFTEWGAKDHTILGNRKIAETATSWSIPIRNMGRCACNSVTFNVDITPRNLQMLDMCEGDTFTYAVSDTHGTVEASGTIVTDSLQLLLIPQVPIRLTGAIASVTLKNRGANYPCSDMDPPMHAALSAPLQQPEAAIIAMPNPFNPAITISIGASNAIPLQTSIFTINGRLVANLKLFNGTATWNAAGMPSGVYIVKAMAGNKRLIRKIVLTR
ncbi:MAG: hypothetical protein A2268_06910 [Candidatus Raymondbacteria bacterium RifOxyA12_full_50_37]|uniref:Secretion system C-terminal sorting domain-containing protein n=1 Tax=Candidatus Raymondbacteria bacterium RIFOXYD12_FULL_49_13 TaxID=1817890 RepID=A0A1F7FE73_UNCRA|nr:MAG: hypothetical protein A2268_06910 [Candidatus Raymondbacteria bacterium RifOxyA12_full_50_37]OGJ91117.1 MAG: hypothetical protein A2248_01065 [Candidatus Raymondbacteria bacterium RIFOXYA2_FULL_49_16]OGJ97514.1 MAG: hypothetical protein A2453_01825 [Candidatus Raymondbacteria bacterium RIFOXYC2_FULL_50_21]OGJ99613.1 MAG: hypothetical protein A2487_07845 [Candidatus Raymondbacteria bacterium RifOxyC12_full_50_8]OGK00182.1 MAG: hypothetical protein A2350_16475 [Candidatus Raymondbacteria b